MDFDHIRKIYQAVKPAVDFSSIRMHVDSDDYLSVRQDVLEPVGTSVDKGAMVTVCDGAEVPIESW